MRKKILFLAGMMACSSLAGAQEISKTWVADKGNGTYQNPVLHADYSDPDICAAGDDFYMTASSFNCIPGIPILHSNDLVNWSLVNGLAGLHLFRQGERVVPFRPDVSYFVVDTSLETLRMLVLHGSPAYFCQSDDAWVYHIFGMFVSGQIFSPYIALHA